MEYTNEEISREILLRFGYSNLKKGKQILITCLNTLHIDKHPSCSVNLDKMVFKCWSCGYFGSLKSLYYEKFGHSIYKDLGIARPITLQKEEIYQQSFDEIPETDFLFTGRFFPADSTPASSTWIQKRGFDMGTLNTLKVKYVRNGRTVKKSDPHNKEEWRFFNDNIIIPVYEKNKLISFEARDLYGKIVWEEKLKKKNKNPEDFSYKKVLFPKYSSTNTLFDLDKLDKNKKLYVVEGLMDVISLRTHKDFLNSTCIFHAIPTERQFYLLSQFKSICIIPNNDIAGLTSLQKIKERLKNTKVLTLPTSVKDVNDILQGKDQRYKNLNNLVQMNWLSQKEKNLVDFDIQEYQKLI